MNNQQKKEYFQLHPEVKTFHFTNDFAFEKLDDAIDHAKKSGQKEPETLTREEAMALENSNEEIPNSNDGVGGAEVNDYTKWTNDQLKAELTIKGIAFDNKANKAALIDLLTAGNSTN